MVLFEFMLQVKNFNKLKHWLRKENLKKYYLKELKCHALMLLDAA